MTRLRFPSLVIIATCCLNCSTSKSNQTPTATATPNTQAPATAPPQSSSEVADVKAAVARVFKDAAAIDSDRAPNFVTGDFNGDGSADVAAIIKAVPDKLSDMNQQFPPWILRDPFATPKPGSPTAQISNKELLLAVIHGFGANGWRDPEATQTFLLKNSVGIDVKSKTKDEVANAAQGKPGPRVSGDLISQTLRGASGYLYYDGAQYAWYDPQTFKGEAETRLTHPGMMPRRTKFDLLHPKLVPAER